MELVQSIAQGDAGRVAALRRRLGTAGVARGLFVIAIIPHLVAAGRAAAHTPCSRASLPPGSVAPPPPVYETRHNTLVCYTPGWNLVGGPAPFPRPTLDLGSRHHPETGAYSQSTTLSVGQGAWAYAPADTTITFITFVGTLLQPDVGIPGSTSSCP